jgi:hypothetical protein
MGEAIKPQVRKPVRQVPTRGKRKYVSRFENKPFAQLLKNFKLSRGGCS